MNSITRITFDPEKAETFLELGQEFLYQEGRIEDAERALIAALELAPENVEILGA